MFKDKKPFISQELGNELERILSAWLSYIANIVFSPSAKKFCFSSFSALGISFIAWVIFWLVRNTVYAQNHSAALNQVSFYTPIFAFVLIISSSTVVGFARANYRAFKCCFDLVISGLSLLAFSPLFLIIAILTKADSAGPVFFKQERLGYNKKIFKMWKFRTMRKNAELETGPVWAQDNDPRVTGIGQFLRKSHLDELPQLINVFKGEMSLIGPRPERPEFSHDLDRHIPYFSKRLDIRPGITGLAQTRYPYGASIRDAAIKLRYDLLYIKRMCWLLDFQIFFWTLGRVLSGEGAR